MRQYRRMTTRFTMRSNVRKELGDIYNIMLRHKADYMSMLTRGGDNGWVYTEFCEDIERHVELYVMRMVKTKQLEVNEAKRFLSTIFDMAVDVYLEGKKLPWWVRLRRKLLRMKEWIIKRY